MKWLKLAVPAYAVQTRAACTAGSDAPYARLCAAPMPRTAASTQGYVHSSPSRPWSPPPGNWSTQSRSPSTCRLRTSPMHTGNSAETALSWWRCHWMAEDIWFVNALDNNNKQLTCIHVANDVITLLSMTAFKWQLMTLLFSCSLDLGQPSFSANPSHRSLLFLLHHWLHVFPRQFTDTAEYNLLLLFSQFLIPLFSFWFSVVD